MLAVVFDLITPTVSLSASLLTRLSVYIQQALRQPSFVQQYPGQLIIKIFRSAKLSCVHLFIFCDTAPIFSKEKPEEGWHLGCAENKNQEEEVAWVHLCDSIMTARPAEVSANIVLGGAESTKE